MFARIRNNFIAGLAVILPAALTIIILQFLIIKINKLILDPIISIYSPYLGKPHLIYLTKGLVLVLFIFLIALIGLATRIIVIRRLFGFGERLFFKIPMIGKIYVAIKQISYAFLGERRGIFKRVILLEYPRAGIYSLGFVTSKSKGEVQKKTKKEMVNVFIPTTPNPTSGMFLLIPEEEAISLDISVEDGLKLIISGGVVVPEYGNSENSSHCSK
jgi:uncharacterized membrane protein